MKKYILEIVVFLSGAVVMILELTGSRVLAPYLGTSLFVWTSLIGLILASLSLGYYLGGKLADKNPSYNMFAFIFLMAGIFIGLTTLFQKNILEFIQNNITEIRLGAIISTLLLFAPPSVFLGMVSPYAVKLKLENLGKSGRTVGNLYAISTIGSIAGTFLAGFFLISYFGNKQLLIIIAIISILNSLFVSTGKLLKIKILSIILLITFLSITYYTEAKADKLIDVDTNYNRVRIYEGKDDNGKKVKVMSINKDLSSAMYLDSDNLVFEYTQFYDLAEHFNPDFKKTLIIGGGAYSYPKHFIKKYKKATIDVIEIDPALTELAKKYFQLKDSPRLKIYHEDGRTFLNKTQNKYDVIFVDAFKSFYSIPHQLTTTEAISKMYDALNQNGVILINIIGAAKGNESDFFKAEYRTFKEIFPQLYLFPIDYPEAPELTQNHILVALKSDKKPTFQNKDPVLNKFLSHLFTGNIELDKPILTDNFAPVDQYIMKLL